jgi:hypothetical protein
MKRINTYFFSIIAICASLTTGLDIMGQGKNIDKTYRWKINADPQGSFTFNNYDCDLTIHTWDKPEIEYALTVDATLKSEEDASRLDGYLGGLEFSHPSGGVQFDNHFWTKRVNTKFKKTITLKGDKTIQYVDLNMKGEMWIPRNCILHLGSKYSEIEVDDLNGEVYLDLYNDKLFGNNVNSKMNITAKYSTLEFKKMKDIEADLYNTDMETGDIGNMVVVSKYSNVQAGDAGRVNINAYNDKYAFGNTGDLIYIDKYSDLKAVKTGNLHLDCYNSTVSISSAEELDLNSKYGKYELAGARTLKITSAYNDNFKIERLGALDINESKYCVYKIDYLERSVQLEEGYSDKFVILQTGALKEVKLNGKYVDVEMGLDKDLNYRLMANVKYAKFDINEESMDVKKMIKDGSEMEMEAVRGVEKEGMPSFFVNGYEMSLTLTEQH